MDEQKKILIAHPTGNANVRGAVDGLHKRGMLHSFHTSVSCFKGNIYYLLSKLPPFKEFRKRSFNDSVKKSTFNYPFMELGRMVAQKIKIRSWMEHESGKFCVDKVYSEMDRKVANYLGRKSNAIDAVYCYEDCAVNIFQKAEELGKKKIFDLPIGYWRTMRILLESERVSRPEWAITLGGFNDSDDKLKRKDLELKLADKIYVASSFTKRTLEDYPGKLADVEVIPYGFPSPNVNRIFEPIADRKIKLLFVGGLSQRKGIANVFEAIEGLEDRVELTVIGAGNIEGCLALKNALSKVQYSAPIPHSEVLAQMASHDVFLFPSLFEGFGLVITEAMSQGTPAITTDRTCGSDIITHGEDGWIVEAGSTDALRNQILELINEPQRIIDAGKKALITASQRPWSRYEEELAESVEKYLYKGEF